MQQAAKPDRVPVLAAIFRWIDRPLAFLGAGLLSALETAAAMMTPVLLQGLIRSVSGDEAGLAGSLLLAAVLLGFTPLIGLGGRRIKRIAREGVGALRQGIFHHILSLPYEMCIRDRNLACALRTLCHSPIPSGQKGRVRGSSGV